MGKLVSFTIGRLDLRYPVGISDQLPKGWILDTWWESQIGCLKVSYSTGVWELMGGQIESAISRSDPGYPMGKLDWMPKVVVEGHTRG
eukprot:15364571-Ditylum_brightwellii.AAC.3